MTTTDDSPGQVRPFADVLRDINRGVLADEARCSLTELYASQCAHCREAAFQVAFVEPPEQVEMGGDE